MNINSGLTFWGDGVGCALYLQYIFRHLHSQEISNNIGTYNLLALGVISSLQETTDVKNDTASDEN